MGFGFGVIVDFCASPPVFGGAGCLGAPAPDGSLLSLLFPFITVELGAIAGLGAGPPVI